MIFNGTIYDKETGAGIPGASIKIMTSDGRYTGVGAAAGKDGSFKLSSSEINWSNYAVISAVGYESIAWELYDDFLNNVRISLTRDVKELDPVVITSDKKQNYAWLLLVPLAIAASKKKQSVGEIGFNMPTVITGAAIIVGLKAFNILDQLLSVFGLGKDKDDKDIEQENADPNSPLKPNIYINATSANKQKARTALPDSKLTSLGQRLIDAFGSWNDDEAQAIGVFKNFRTKNEASYFADTWENTWNYPDLLQWLKGDAYPNDRLDTGEINQILKYLDNLPMY